MTDIEATHQASYTNSVHDFRKIIEKECARGDRYHSKLSLIIYEIGTDKEQDLIVRQFIRLMGERVRTMDDIGWFDIGQIGVLLPHTATEGAFRLSKDISKILDAIPTPLPFTIYSYPSQRWPVKPKLSIVLTVRLALQKIFHRHSITSCDDFRVYLNLELDRATRYDYLFSLIIFHLDNTRTQGNPATKLAKHLSRRLRETDEIGWFGENKIAAILPYAENQDCQNIVEAICKEASLGTKPTFSVYTYPTNWPSDMPESSTNSHPPRTSASKILKNTSQTKGARRTKNNDRKSDPPITTKKISQKNNQYERETTSSHDALDTEEIELFFRKTIPEWKRCLDILVAALSMIFFSPLFLFAILGIKATSPGPIFFKQKRVGYMQRQFFLYKFRTMHANAGQESHRKLMKRLISKEGDKGNTKLPKDNRIFPFGRLLRKSSIDELPQLLNVLKGEMSLVGPRPCLPYEAEEYLRWHTKRFATIPGLTGLWQVSGKNKLSFQQMIRLDIRYEKKLSLWFDIKILLKTIPAIISIFFTSSE